MKNEKITYKKYAEQKAEKSPLWKDCFLAFLFGGGICLFGQGLFSLYAFLGCSEKTAGILVSVTLIFLAALFTGIGIFDRIARIAGAGTLVPITGFANAMASPAIDAKAEGWILGVGAKTFNVAGPGLGSKLFTIAGPVILYGTLASVLYGVIYYIVGLF